MVMLSRMKEARAEHIVGEACSRLMREFRDDPLEDYLEALRIMEAELEQRIQTVMEELGLA